MFGAGPRGFDIFSQKYAAKALSAGLRAFFLA